MSLTPQELQTQLEAACPGIGNRLGDWSDKSTWELLFPDGATDAQKAAAQAVIDAATIPLVMSQRQWTPYEFYQKFTAAERSALKASTDATVQEFMSDMALYQVVYPDSDEMTTAMSCLVTLGIITDARKTQILQ